jgi:hypothetical protein
MARPEAPHPMPGHACPDLTCGGGGGGGRAESRYVVGGVTGNYERELENSPAARLSTDGRASARDVASLIIDSAYRSGRTRGPLPHRPPASLARECTCARAHAGCPTRCALRHLSALPLACARGCTHTGTPRTAAAPPTPTAATARARPQSRHAPSPHEPRF